MRLQHMIIKRAGLQALLDNIAAGKIVHLDEHETKQLRSGTTAEQHAGLARVIAELDGKIIEASPDG